MRPADRLEARALQGPHELLPRIDGEVLAEWSEALSTTVQGIRIDSRDVRERFGLGEFTGLLPMLALTL